jgi:uncharacterized membrane protein YfcA
MNVTLVLIASGAFAGLLGGMFGIGGSVILVPILIYLFESQGVAHSIVPHLAMGTSLATILVTNGISSLSHHQKGNLDWPVVGALSLFTGVGAQIGVLMVGGMDGAVLKPLLGVFQICMGLTMWMRSDGVPSPHARTSRWLYAGGGTGIGIVSSFFGIGGGTLMVPFLVYGLGHPIKRAIGCASAQGVVIALSGSIGYILQGLEHPQLPAGAWGYVALPSALWIVAGSATMAHFGVTLSDRVPVGTLRRLFALLVIIVGARLSGLW